MKLIPVFIFLISLEINFNFGSYFLDLRVDGGNLRKRGEIGMQGGKLKAIRYNFLSGINDSWIKKFYTIIRLLD